MAFYCVVEFLFHCGVGGCDRRGLSGSKFPRRDAETRRVWLDQRKILCTAAGCSLMGLAKTYWILFLCQEEHNRSDSNSHNRQFTLTDRPGDGLNAVDDTG